MFAESEVLNKAEHGKAGEAAGSDFHFFEGYSGTVRASSGQRAPLAA